ncbi:hypothetical protein G6F69_009518 [Rhizopus microsporus]|nr:hypothetical protein G6F69_009518 [Rhizopus microsporus]
MYNSVINTLKTFFLRKNFVENIKKWTTRDTSTGALRDIYDGRVWNEFKLNAGDALPFVKESVYNLMLTINIDWFQPYKGTHAKLEKQYHLCWIDARTQGTKNSTDKQLPGAICE